MVSDFTGVWFTASLVAPPVRDEDVVDFGQPTLRARHDVVADRTIPIHAAALHAPAHQQQGQFRASTRAVR
jgi:hypothetical protein